MRVPDTDCFCLVLLLYGWFVQSTTATVVVNTYLAIVYECMYDTRLHTFNFTKKILLCDSPRLKRQPSQPTDGATRNTYCRVISKMDGTTGYTFTHTHIRLTCMYEIYYFFFLFPLQQYHTAVQQWYHE